MSEDDNQPKPPKPMKKTSAVPLKKETVRVTLKADGAAEPPKTAPSPAPTKPPAPAPTIPLKSAPKTGAAPKPAAPAPTVQLKAPGQPSGPKTTPLKTQPLSAPSGAPAPGGTQALPKATVQLGSATQALGAPTALASTQAATIQTAAAEDEAGDNETIASVLSIVAFVAALIVLFLQISTTAKWVDEEEPVGNESGWNALFE